MNILPHGWVKKPLQELVILNEKFKDIDDETICGFVPMNLVPTSYLGRLEHNPRKWAECKKGYTHFQNGDVILAKITPCFENGKSALVTDLPNGVGAGSTEYFVLRSLGIEPRYLHAFLKTKEFVDDCTVRMSGSVGHKRVPKDYLQQYFLPIAPLNEQIRIANKLDSLLAKVDQAQARLEKIPTLLKRFRQSVLAAATSGELTKEWREYELGCSQWSEILLGDIAEVFTGVTPLKKESAYYDGGSIPWLTSAVTGMDLVTRSEYFITEKALKQCRLKLFKPGTLLVAMYGEGKTRGQVTEIAIEATINQACAAVVVYEEKAVRQYVKLCIESNYERTRMMAEGGNQPNLNLSKVRRIPINLPSVTEQKEIVRRVDSLFALADAVEKQYQSAKKRVDRLTQSILAKAFRGELVPQDPSDEPASKLLERIQTERATQGAIQPKKKRKMADLSLEQDSVHQSAAATVIISRKVRVMKLSDAPESYLYNLLNTLGGEAHAEHLWKQSELSIDDFYAKLKQEMKGKTIIEDRNTSDPSLRKLRTAKP